MTTNAKCIRLAMDTANSATAETRRREAVPQFHYTPLYWLAVGTFAVGTEGFMIAAILPRIASDLFVSVQAAGQLVTIFAFTYAISSPILTALTGGFDRRKLLILSMSAFAVANMAGWDGVYYYFGHSNIVDFDGRVLGECGEAPDEVQYAELSIPSIRSSRKNWTAENHLFKLLHRGYTAREAAGEEPASECPYEFYVNWVKDPEGTRKKVEQITRKTTKPEVLPTIER